MNRPDAVKQPDHDELDWDARFGDESFESRRLLAEVVGTFFLVLAAAGAVTVDAFTGGGIGRVAGVVAPGLMVMAVILTLGNLSGAHLNPAVTIGFAARGYFQWKRVPGYIVAQLAGAVLACALLSALFGHAGDLGMAVPGPGVTALDAFVVEGVLTFGLVTVILGTAAGARNTGPLSALAVGGYIALAGLWSSPITGALMNPARALGSNLLTWRFPAVWAYVLGPLAGALLAVAVTAMLLGGKGRGDAKKVAQGSPGEGG